ncbi:MAG: glycosyltransferase [Kiritimatiellia bacterium]
MNLISIIVPLYRVKEWLPQTIASLKAQTYQTFECLCLDDGSGNGMAEFARTLTADDTRFKVIEFPNAGVAETRNRGLHLAQGDFVTFIDQDDFYHPRFLETLHSLLVEHDADCALCAFELIPTAQNFESMQWTVSTPLIEMSEEPLRKFFEAKSDIFNVWQKLYRREAIQKIRLDSALFGSDDALYTFDVFATARRVVFTDEILYYYRSQPQSVTRQNPSQYALSRLALYPQMKPKISEALLPAFRQHVLASVANVIKISRPMSYTREEHCAICKAIGMTLHQCGLSPWKWSVGKQIRYWRYRLWQR